MDFYSIRTKEGKNGWTILYPDFEVRGASKDLMVQGGKFYAIWDEAAGFWSTDEFDVSRLVDEELYAEVEKRAGDGARYTVHNLTSTSTGSWSKFKKYMKEAPDNWRPLNTELAWTNTKLTKTNYASKTLPYALEPGDISAWDELVGTLYAVDQRAKIEWAIGSIVSGDSKKLQKFFVFYGSAGTGKSTIINIIEQLFEGYTAPFDGKQLGSSNGDFAMGAFKNNPLVAFQHDADLSRLEDNARLNSIISHENMTVNEKYKTPYTARIDALLFLGSNQPVKISDSKSGIIRRLIDIHPTGVTIPFDHFTNLMGKISAFELGPIAHHCLSVYKHMGKDYYKPYRPTEMQFQTDPFFNFVEAYFDVFRKEEYLTLKQIYKMYKEFCDEAGYRPATQMRVRGELDSYFEEFHEQKMIDGVKHRSVYTGFTGDLYKKPKEIEKGTYSLVLEETESLLDELLANKPAQLAKEDGTPQKRWGSVTTKLADIDSHVLHYVKVDPSHIVIDFDLKDQNGEKALERNLEVASRWPSTYAEISKSGEGVHLHYTYTGNPNDLASEYSDGIEVKVYRGDAALRRKLSRCNGVPVSEISSGLPLKEKKEKVHKAKVIKSERGLRELIERNLKKEIHPGTKPSVDFIHKILEEAYESGMKYDVSDMRSRIVAFANNSSNQAGICLKVVGTMQFKSEESEEVPGSTEVEIEDDRLVFYDVEVYPNLFVICWKFHGKDEVVKMINPPASEVEQLFRLKLVGFYNRRYDNHILYAASMGASTAELFKLSQRLVEGNRGGGYGAAYNLSYADIWDFASEKKSLKKWEVDLGILHMELDIPWDKDVDKSQWDQVVEYCANDVRATEQVFEDRKGDFTARQILAELSGLTVNDTTQQHTAKIIFGENKKPQNEFVYTDLSKEFPGYKFEMGKSSYKGEDPSEGGYVYAEPGMYEHVVELDVVSMHPRSIEVLNLFGPYTKNFTDLIEARVAIKHGDFEKARNMMSARLAPYLTDESSATQLAYALKIVVNTVYGLTSAKFDNPFRDIRNVDNIVAKRGALFMIDLKEFLHDKGVQVVHIKTDSVKVVDDKKRDVIKLITEFGKKYGYDFEHENTYDKFVLVNDAVFVAGWVAVPWEKEFPGYTWKAVGAQFQHPYVFKSLFSGEDTIPEDFYEARTVVKGAMYLDMSCSDEPDLEKMRHVGKTGQFVPVVDGGGKLYRVYDGKFYAVSRTKGHLWMEAIAWESLDDGNSIDMTYFDKLKDEALETIEKFGSFDSFTKEP